MLNGETAVVPVLTEKTVITAGAIKDRQIHVSIFCRRFISIFW